ncbi:beta-ketoacyl-ACP synthase II [Planctomycetota bacterium]
MENTRRVVVTGCGVISSLGIGKDVNWSGVTSGKNGIGPITLFDASEHKTHFAGEVKDFDPNEYLDTRVVKRNDRFSHLALVAAHEAWEDAGLDMGREDPGRIATIIGVGIGGMQSYEDQVKKLLDKGPRRVSPYLIPQMISDSAAGLVSIKYGLKGPNFDVSSACASGAHGIGESFLSIKHGISDVAVTGGVEAAITPVGVAGFNAMSALSERNDEPLKASRPFDKNRDGFVIAEGGAVIVLEEFEHARKRNANIYAELKGYGATGDAFHITAPCEDGDGAFRAMITAMKMAQLNPEDIDYCNAHGTSTQYNDRTETMALKSAFKDHAYTMPVSSTKSMTGHMLGGTGAVEAVFSMLSIIHNTAPPTINYEEKDPECDLDYVPNTAREMDISCVITNNFGFGGHNASLIFAQV